MAEIQDEVDLGEIEAVEEIAQVEQKSNTPELPDKYKGKSVEDVVKMHQDAERLIDRQSQEVGEVRKLADELIKSQLHNKPAQEQATEVDFFENPQEAVRLAVENNPKVIAAEQYAMLNQMELAKRKVAELHPDFSDVVRSDDFKTWIGSSKIRTQLYNQAENYSVDAADELLSTFKELKMAKARKDVETITDFDTKSRDKSLLSASVDTGGSGESSRKVYRRTDLIRLKMNNPAKFASMQDEIDVAYQEGRVR